MSIEQEREHQRKRKKEKEQQEEVTEIEGAEEKVRRFDILRYDNNSRKEKEGIVPQDNHVDRSIICGGQPVRFCVV